MVGYVMTLDSFRVTDMGNGHGDISSFIDRTALLLAEIYKKKFLKTVFQEIGFPSCYHSFLNCMGVSILTFCLG